MNIDILLCARILQEQDMAQVIKSGIRGDALQGTGKTAFDFILEFLHRYNGLPSAETVLKETQVDVGLAPEPLGFYLEKIQKRYRDQIIIGGMREARDAFEKDCSEDAITALQAAILKASAINADHNQISTLADGIDEFIDGYLSAKTCAGPTGLLTPWGWLNEATWGLNPGDFLVIAARPGTGKTFFMLKIAENIWKNAGKVLFVSCEMGRRAIARRFTSLASGIQYSGIKHGRLEHHEEAKLLASLEEYRTGFKRVIFVPPGRTQTVSQIDVIAQEHKPDLIVVDSFYYLKAEKPSGKDNIDIRDVTQALKQMAERRGIPLLASTQLNRESAKSSGKKKSQEGGRKSKLPSIGVEHIAYGDAVGQTADYIFALYQSLEMKEERELGIIPLKGREEFNVASWVMNFDVDSMDFELISDDDTDDDSGENPVGAPPRDDLPEEDTQGTIDF